ncbi:GNAT family N-acetyltransferase [Halomicrobium urmianum]|uniref:GNAT family N-acetyltransferase n=1 Tax=Halomicrobium urmianum TaxID=1586233 RepID=UPI001CD92D93|nr:GNAT family N-acetyltransferase [Halomicrobium urmianum]
MPEAGVERVDDESLEPALSVRRAVFVEEQGVPEDRERDGRDAAAVHFLACEAGDPVGTARLRRVDDATGKVERVAVLPDHRGEGWGRRLMAAVEDEARRRGLDRLRLHAQTSVEGFYRALDYQTTSDVFEEAGIPHVEMETELR